MSKTSQQLQKGARKSGLVEVGRLKETLSNCRHDCKFLAVAQENQSCEGFGGDGDKALGFKIVMDQVIDALSYAENLEAVT